MNNVENLEQKAKAFASDPVEYFNYSYTNIHSIPREELEELQLAAAQNRFGQMSDAVPMLKKLADSEGIRNINSLEDLVPLLFEHTMYKSYPRSLLDNARFDQLTKWLNKLTAHDLSGIQEKAKQCQGITDWVKLLDAETPLEIAHSSGTTGTMSFIPTSKHDYRMMAKAMPALSFQKFGDPAPDPDNYIPNVHMVSPSHRYGFGGYIRFMNACVEFIAGAKERVHTLYPGRQDSDVLFLAARIRAAKAKGELDKLKIDPALLAQQQEFQEQQAQMPQDLERFFDVIVDELAGESVNFSAPWKMMYDMAIKGLERGLKNVFAPDSVVFHSGGAKGLVQPDDWEETVKEFAGVDCLSTAYGMSELLGLHVACSHGHFHVVPWIVPFLLDPDTSELLPRTGVVTGRAAFYDVLSNGKWGGFISGDEITVHWDCDCPCGQSTVYIESNIGRYSEKRGGDDKISCAATPEAHKEAMDYLTQFEETW